MTTASSITVNNIVIENTTINLNPPSLIITTTRGVRIVLDRVIGKSSIAYSATTLGSIITYGIVIDTTTTTTGIYFYPSIIMMNITVIYPWITTRYIYSL